MGEDAATTAEGFGNDPHGRHADDRDLVNRALSRLDMAHRAVMILHDIDGNTAAEIARALDVPEGTVSSRLRVARADFAASVRRLQGQPQ